MTSNTTKPNLLVVTPATDSKTANVTPSAGLVRLHVVLRLIPVSASTWWAGVKSGRYPQPIKLGARITAWRIEDILALTEKTLPASEQ